tara:strand:+ start:677 stop:1561 length:885 start_codon:yes stop_codon:yes gene_type:complete
MSAAVFIGVDWGTTNLRAWTIDAHGVALGARTSEAGMGGLTQDGFGPALDDLIAGWPSLPVLACGMVGARQGWVEAPYVRSPGSSEALAGALVAVPGRADTWIVPGVALRDASGALVDVMRGEETQAIGVAGTEPSLLLCPGTHGKWIETGDGEVRDFQTFMTGELNALLGRQSVLRHSVDGEATPGPVFLAAVRDMLDGASLTSALFSVRVGTLDGRLDGPGAASRLSGLVIGAEVAAGLARFGLRPVTLIGDDRLNSFYAAALGEAGYTTVQTVNGAEAVCRGLARIWRHRS